MSWQGKPGVTARQAQALFGGPALKSVATRETPGLGAGCQGRVGGRQRCRARSRWCPWMPRLQVASFKCRTLVTFPGPQGKALLKPKRVSGAFRLDQGGNVDRGRTAWRGLEWRQELQG